MNQDTVDVRSRRHAHVVPPFPNGEGGRRFVNIATVGVVATVVGSVIVSRHVERKLLFSRAALIGIAAELLIFAFLRRHRVTQILKEFFTATAHPMNLAIFRMAVFWAIFHEVHLDEIGSFSRMPSGLQFAPWGMGAVLPHLPIHARLAGITGLLLLVFSTAGFVGIFSRASALACAVLGFYAFGIPQFYGKVDHNHHLLWFAMILAVSPCGDFLALDAAVAAWKRADRGITDPLRPSRAYALPLRFVMLLMGVIYFFPGFWKLWQSGFDWFLGQNLPGQLHLFWTWSFDGHWAPAFRIDRHVLVCRISAVATVLFELTFVFFMFSRKLRGVAAVAGLVFHTATNRFMRISFLSLRICYVALFDWVSIFGLIGGVVNREELVLVYDGSSKSARRLVGLVRVWDILGRVNYVNCADKQMLASLRLSLPWAGQELGAPDRSAAVHNGTRTRFSAYCALALRIPLMWPILPIFCFWPAASRVFVVCEKPLKERPFEPERMLPTAGGQRAQVAWVAVVGCVLLLGSVMGGISRHINGWPFACYPTFSLPPPERIVSLSVAAETPSGETEVTNFGFPYHRFYGLSRNILAIEDPLARNERLLLLWVRAEKMNPDLRAATAVKFYVESLWTDPDQWGRNPQDRKPFFVWHPASNISIPQPYTNTRFTCTEWQ